MRDSDSVNGPENIHPSKAANSSANVGVEHIVAASPNAYTASTSFLAAGESAMVQVSILDTGAKACSRTKFGCL